MNDDLKSLIADTESKVESADETSKRNRILDAAEAEFAEKGITGSRVDQIARRAGVAKALIYYHFKSKKRLFDEIIERYLAEHIAYGQRTLGSIQEGEDFFSQFLTASLEFVKTRNDVLRIFLMELLKKDSSEIPIFDVFDRLFGTAKDFKKYLPDQKDDAFSTLKLQLFFFASLPISMFFLMEEKWVAHYQVDKKVLEAEFVEAFNQAHSDFFRRLLGSRLGG